MARILHRLERPFLGGTQGNARLTAATGLVADG
jgi:hypothetical protein